MNTPTPGNSENQVREELRHAQDELRSSETRLKGIIASAMDAIISVDRGQRILLFNPAAERLFRIPAEEALGKHLNTLIPDRFRTAHGHDVERFGNTGVSNRQMGDLGTLSALRSTGEEFPIEASISQVEVQGEKIFTVILRDVSDRQRSERELQRYQAGLERTVAERTAQLREMVGDLEHFSYTITHDMRAPLRAMQAFGHILLEEHQDQLNDTGKDYLRRIVQSSERMDHLITDALSYAKIVREELKLERVELEPLITGMLETYPQFRRPFANVVLEPPIPSVLGNRAALTQCFSNLVANAVKFVDAGKIPDVRIWAEIRDDFIRVWVGDNGIGISKEDLSKLFGMFERLSNTYEGTGIGLALVKKVVERMKGRVGVESEPGVGSRFWVELRPA